MLSPAREGGRQLVTEKIGIAPSGSKDEQAFSLPRHGRPQSFFSFVETETQMAKMFMNILIVFL